MKGHRFLLFFVLVAGGSAGRGAEVATVSTASNWRDALAEDIRTEYAGRLAASDATTAAPASDGWALIDDDVLALEPITVHTTSSDPEIERLIARRAAQFQSSRVERALVHTVYQRDFGKVRVGVVSLLGVPILAGLSW